MSKPSEIRHLSSVALSLRSVSDMNDPNRPRIGTRDLDREIRRVLRDESWGERADRARYAVTLIEDKVRRAYKLSAVA